MLIHVYSHMGKELCVDANGTVVLGSETLYFDCNDDVLEYIRCGQPCCIVLNYNELGQEITLYDCTINKGKTIRYKKRIIGRSINGKED